MKISIKKIFILLFLVSLSLQVSCLDDDGDTGGTAVLKIKVNTDTRVWGYPEFDGETCTAAYEGDTSGLWQYPLVGGGDLEVLSDDPVPYTERGTKVNMVYIYEQMGTHSKQYPAVYRGESLENEGVITIEHIVAGTYYVVAFYDYCSGGNKEEMLKRYDRYAIYTTSTEADVTFGNANSTPFRDRATAIEIGDGETVEITMKIDRDWVLGKPKTETSESAGRTFLTYGEEIPVP